MQAWQTKCQQARTGLLQTAPALSQKHRAICRASATSGTSVAHAKITSCMVRLQTLRMLPVLMPIRAQRRLVTSHTRYSTEAACAAATQAPCLMVHGPPLWGSLLPSTTTECRLSSGSSAAWSERKGTCAKQCHSLTLAWTRHRVSNEYHTVVVLAPPPCWPARALLDDAVSEIKSQAWTDAVRCCQDCIPNIRNFTGVATLNPT